MSLYTRWKLQHGVMSRCSFDVQNPLGHMNFLQDVSYAKVSCQSRSGQPWLLNCFQPFLKGWCPAYGEERKVVNLVVSWQSRLPTLCESGKSGCITYWSTDDSRWKRKFIKGCYMTHFSILHSNLLNKICGGKTLFQNVIFPLNTSTLNRGVPF